MQPSIHRGGDCLSSGNAQKIHPYKIGKSRTLAKSNFANWNGEERKWLPNYRTTHNTTLACAHHKIRINYLMFDLLQFYSIYFLLSCKNAHSRCALFHALKKEREIEILYFIVSWYCCEGLKLRENFLCKSHSSFALSSLSLPPLSSSSKRLNVKVFAV